MRLIEWSGIEMIWVDICRVNILGLFILQSRELRILCIYRHEDVASEFYGWHELCLLRYANIRNALLSICTSVRLCVSFWLIYGPINYAITAGLSPVQHHAFSWTDVAFALIGPFRTNISFNFESNYKNFHTRICIWKFRKQQPVSSQDHHNW